jgi:segregation and condensation protein B
MTQAATQVSDQIEALGNQISDVFSNEIHALVFDENENRQGDVSVPVDFQGDDQEKSLSAMTDEFSAANILESLGEADDADIEGTELAGFESAEIEVVDEISETQMVSILESLLFATEKPQSVAMLKAAFIGTRIKSADIREGLERLQQMYEDENRGVILEEVGGGYQIRTKPANKVFLQRTVKARPFKLSGQALEVLAIVAYKQPCPKSAVDDVRGVESGHLMRGLLDRGLLTFAGKSELPGRPMTYETTRKFLEIFGLRNLGELPSLSEIDQLIPEGIGDTPEEKPKLSDMTGALSTEIATGAYSQGEEELLDISQELKAIDTTTAFFEDEKRRQKEKKELEKATDIRERLLVGEPVENRDRKWLERYDAAILAAKVALESGVVAPVVVEQVAVEQTAAESVAAPVTESEVVLEQSPTGDSIDEQVAPIAAAPMEDPEVVVTSAATAVPSEKSEVNASTSVMSSVSAAFSAFAEFESQDSKPTEFVDQNIELKDL